MEQPWSHLFLMLSQRLWCNTWRNAPLQLADKRYPFGCAALTTLLLLFTKRKMTLFTTTLTSRTLTSSLPKKLKIRKWKTSFSRLFRISRDNNELRTTVPGVQKTDGYRQITWRIILEPDPTLTRRAQLVCETQDRRKKIAVFVKKVLTKTLTLLGETFNEHEPDTCYYGDDTLH